MNILMALDIVSKIAIPAGLFWVGYQAYKINKDKLKLDLYDRRLALYLRAVELCIVLAHDEVDFDVLYTTKIDFVKHAVQARFLFGELSDVCKIVNQFSAELMTQQKVPNLDKLEKLLKELEHSLIPWMDFRDISKSRRPRKSVQNPLWDVQPNEE